MSKFYIVFLSLMAFSTTLVAQTEDEACLHHKKKILKLIEAGKNASDAPTAIANFNKAIDENSDNATPYYEYAMYAFESGSKYYEKNPNPAMGDKSFQKSKEMFLKTLEKCSDFHANCFYYLGVINYSQKNMEEAIKWFGEFKKFKSSNNDRYPADYDKKIADINEILPDLKNEVELKTNQVPFNPSMVKNVSSKNDEYFPMISPDNEIMFFTRKDTVDKMNTGVNTVVYENFTLSFRTNVSELFSNGKALSKPFNDGSFSSYGAATMSVDNKEMIFCACQEITVQTATGPQPYKNCDLYRTEYERTGAGGNDYTWTQPENLGTGINTQNGWEGQPTLSADGQTLFYTVLRPNNTTDNDIWTAQKMPNGKWGNFKPFIHNTSGKDKSPFLHQDSETLYFVSAVSDKRKGVGGLDIFYTRWDAEYKNPDGSKGNWGTPKNIGYPINTEADELGIFVSTDGTLAYYSSRQGGNWNIYSFELYEEARPTGVTILKGELKDENGNPIEGAEIEVAYEGTGEVTKIKVNGNDGKYATVVKNNTHHDVMVTVKKEGYAFDSKVITKEELEKTQAVPLTPKVEPVTNKTETNPTKTNNEEEIVATLRETKKPNDVSIRANNLVVKEIKVGEAYTINDILFATNSYALNERSKFILKQFASFLKENPNVTIMIQGHTDDQGDDKQNLLLSDGRANAVKLFLIACGIESSRLSSKGFGETLPKVENTSELNRAKNRRTDFVIEKIN
ncbi:MAG: OmpA family protein [Flavobacteriia bacterium]|nr:OmpA family protein [Flavobacteriia bacterium]